jgi:hypothetical protein
VIKKFLAKYPNIRYVKKTNSNWGGVLKYVANHPQLINGHWVKIIDCDDLIYTQNLLSIINYLSQYRQSDIDCVFSSYIIANTKKNTKQVVYPLVKKNKCYITTFDHLSCR